MNQTKQALKVIGTLLFLFGVFGYIFPKWGGVVFTNNENLFHVIIGISAILFAEGSARLRQGTLIFLALFFLTWGIWGFTLNQPLDAKLLVANRVNLSHQLDMIDNYIHILFGLAFAWFLLNTRRHSPQ